MADKELNEVPKVKDMEYVPVIMEDGNIGQIAKADLASVVAGLMPNPKISVGLQGITCTYYAKPTFILRLTKQGEGNAVFTLAVCELSDSHFCNIHVFTTPTNIGLNCDAGFADIQVQKTANTGYVSSCTGSISNGRVVNHNGKNYYAIDVRIIQYGGNDIYVTGLHSHLSDIFLIQN